MKKEPTMWVKVLKCKDTKGNEIARADAFGGSIHVYTIGWMDGYGLYPTDSEEEIIGDFEDAAELPARVLRALVSDELLNMFPTLRLTDFRFGRVVKRDAAKYFSI